MLKTTMLALIKSTANLKTSIPLLNAYRNNYFPASYLNPLPKTELERLESEGKLDSFKVLPVKSAPDNMTESVYDDPIFKYFTNIVMQWSNRVLARELMFDTFTNIKKIQLMKYHKASDEDKSSIIINPMIILKEAIENCKPVLSLTPIKKGGIVYQVPVPISPKRSQWMAMKWLVMAARDKEGPISFVEQLSRELLDAFHSEGRVVKRKQDLHKICENNKAYAHYRWS